MRASHAAALLLAAMTMMTARSASAQISALVSPGRLAKAHASLEGIGSCLSCHAAGRKVAADRCLSCHQPVARRIAEKKGVHRGVTTDCTSCHVEHAGVDAELRPFDQRNFNHATGAGFPLDGQHAAIATNCAACHKTRSFLTVNSSCASCHADIHKGALGSKCEACHTTAIKFSDTSRRFDHTRTTFPLTGAHGKVACESCHRNSTFKGTSQSCATCHRDPHGGRFGTSCASCHVADAWRTTKIDHSRTNFPLRGAHGTVACAQCHVKPPMQVKAASATCTACHTDPHKGNFQQDCRACHNESSFRLGTFDHSKTRFALADGHAGLACAACHDPAASRGRGGTSARSATAVDFRGLQTDCVSCHADVHQGELGSRCETCHTSKSFHVATFTHARARTFFEGQHAALTCVACHPPGTTRPLPVNTPMVKVGLPRTPDSCVSCHRDVHAGQLGTACETCHTVATPHFAVTTFAHDRTRFPLTGKHASVTCQDCHTAEPPATGRPPAVGVRRFTGIGTACATCHRDPHAGELPAQCETCHSTATFAIESYQHRNARALRSFFTGRHLVSCAQCHKRDGGGDQRTAVVGARPTASAKPAPAVARTLSSFKASTACVSCHNDIHRGSLGPRCETCHKP